MLRKNGNRCVHGGINKYVMFRDQHMQIHPVTVRQVADDQRVFKPPRSGEHSLKAVCTFKEIYTHVNVSLSTVIRGCFFPAQ